ncbi:MAG TPA: COX15/CtaA family protein, partial [Usitatibacter sp.]|nr:COX15/CtaA family protein [Usitatibacter sp.]
LAALLGMAFLIYALMLWTALDLLAAPARAAAAHARRLGTALVVLVFVMVLSGALVAGIRAGFAYNTWPLMNGQWIPGEILLIEPWWDNFVHNMATVQFDHRAIAYVIVALTIVTWLRLRAAPGDARARRWGHAMLLVVALQVCLGIATLLLRVPVPLAALHQAGAVMVFTCALGLRHAMRAAGRLQK